MDGPSKPTAPVFSFAAQQPKTQKELTNELISYVKSASDDSDVFDEHIGLWQRDIAVYEYTPALLKMMHELSEPELHHPLFQLFVEDIPLGALRSFIENIDRDAIDDAHFNFLESALHERRTNNLTSLHTKSSYTAPRDADPRSTNPSGSSTPDSGIESS